MGGNVNIAEIGGKRPGKGAPVHGQKSVVTAGTAVALASSTALTPDGIFIKPLSGNAGLVYVGNSAVTSSNGVELAATDGPIWWPVDNAADLYIDCEGGNTDGVSWWGADGS